MLDKGGDRDAGVAGRRGDLLIAGLGFEQFAANVAEYYDIPLAVLHFFPMRPNGRLLRFLPAPLGRAAMTAYERLSWGGPVKEVEQVQRRELGLPEATMPLAATDRRTRITGNPGLRRDVHSRPGSRMGEMGWPTPFVGALTMESPTDADEKVASWIAAGTPPIFFGFGSIPVGSAADTLAMIGAACTRLGERALVSAGSSDFSNVPHFEHVKVVERGEFRGDLSGLPRGRAPRWRGHPGLVPCAPESPS